MNVCPGQKWPGFLLRCVNYSRELDLNRGFVTGYGTILEMTVNAQMKTVRFLFLLTSVLLVAGCASNFDAADFEGLRQVGQDEYEVFYEDHRGVFGSEKSLQKKVVLEANSFASQRGMVASPIEARQHRVGILGDWAWAYYRFELVPNNGSQFNKSADQITFIADANMSNNFLESMERGRLQRSQDKQSIYDELLQLNELREKGILTEEEFQEQKELILEKNNQ